MRSFISSNAQNNDIIFRHRRIMSGVWRQIFRPTLWRFDVRRMSGFLQAVDSAEPGLRLQGERKLRRRRRQTQSMPSLQIQKVSPSQDEQRW